MAAKLARLTHKITIQLHLVAQRAVSQLSLQAASPETFGYTFVLPLGHQVFSIWGDVLGIVSTEILTIKITFVYFQRLFRVHFFA
jgi:hypothetical protein